MTENTSYKSFSRALVNVDIGLHIGLAGVNITLVGECISQQDGIGCNFGSHTSGYWGCGPSSPHTRRSWNCLQGCKRSLVFIIWQETQ